MCIIADGNRGFDFDAFPGVATVRFCHAHPKTAVRGALELATRKSLNIEAILDVRSELNNSMKRFESTVRRRQHGVSKTISRQKRGRRRRQIFRIPLYPGNVGARCRVEELHLLGLNLALGEGVQQFQLKSSVQPMI